MGARAFMLVAALSAGCSSSQQGVEDAGTTCDRNAFERALANPEVDCGSGTDWVCLGPRSDAGFMELHACLAGAVDAGRSARVAWTSTTCDSRTDHVLLALGDGGAMLVDEYSQAGGNKVVRTRCAAFSVSTGPCTQPEGKPCFTCSGAAETCSAAP